jgi:hypothetical protein
MADQEDGPNSMDFPIGVGSFTGHTRGGDGEPLSFGPGTYRNVFDGNADQSGAGNYTVKSFHASRSAVCANGPDPPDHAGEVLGRLLSARWCLQAVRGKPALLTIRPSGWVRRFKYLVVVWV